ncbi:protein NRT1/ PTR FAMILY 5.5-like [Spinacia oleracea]|uniref:Protein NRT1/ PTR FAMILY 5.5-like n=1 Tax=Spinacia oleracea TaxID=3562 RepID=A0ABM3QR60_SPIOL|nr:protein NRT1/ PTR FAMILY 5.5-like [Spinacia oleracea]
MVCRTHLVALAALLVAAFVKPWAILFGICAILGMVSFFACLILRVTKGYNNPVPRPVGSPLTTIFRVLFAAFSKSFYPRPRDMNNLYEASDPNQQLLPHTKNLRCLDKAAIVKAGTTLEQQEGKRWRLCKVTEVEQTKIFIRNIPIWMTFIVCGNISEARTRTTNWFQSTLNSSRLDNYYWVLATLAAMNLVMYVVMAFLYTYTESRVQMVEGTITVIDHHL